MSEPTKDTIPLYALTPEQVAFIRQLFGIVVIQGNRQQWMTILTTMAEIEEALKSPVVGKETT